VLAAFGAAGATATALPGGQGSSWLAPPLVLKPVGSDLEAEEVAWLAEALPPLSGESAEASGVRLPAEVPGPGGRWVVDGWRALTWVAGEPGPVGRWAELFAAARAFTAAVAHVPRPPFLQRRTNPWAVADRAAWDEEPLVVHPAQQALVDQLRALTGRGPEPDRPSQLVHGDLTGNVLFSSGLPPAVIDVSPYWRPAAYAGAVVVADGLLWWDQGADLVAAAGESGDVDLVARALLFRLLTDVELELLRGAGTAVELPDVQAERYRRAVDVLATRGP
jgi:uncharacterized protein (TIGR02569 family)